MIGISDQSQVPSVIQADAIYTLDEFKKRQNIKSATIRAARRAGFLVRHIHGKAFVIGQDWIDHVRTNCNESTP
jgi:hypothetical protein